MKSDEDAARSCASVRVRAGVAAATAAIAFAAAPTTPAGSSHLKAVQGGRPERVGLLCLCALLPPPPRRIAPRRRRMGGMSQAICIKGVEGGEMAFVEVWSHPVYIPVIPDYTERTEPNSGLKMFAGAHLRLGIGIRRYEPKKPGFWTALNRLVQDFEGTPNSGLRCLGSPTRRPRGRSSRCAS